MASNLLEQTTKRLGALGQRDFALFFSAFSLSLIGSAMVPVALSFALFARGRGAGAVSAVLAAETVPMVLLLLIGGVVADRLPRRSVLVAADLLRCASQALLGGLLLAGYVSLPLIMTLATLVGVGNAFYSPGRSGLIPEIVSADQLQSANALTAVAQSVGTLAGPVLGGVLVASAGAPWAIMIDAFSYAVGAGLLLSMRTRTMPSTTEAPNLLGELGAGWAEFTRRLWIWVIVVQFALFHLLVYGPLIVLGALSFAHVPQGALRWGGLMSMLGAGALLGGMLGLRLRPRRPIQMALWLFVLFALLPASLACHWPYRIQTGCFLLGGVGIALFNVFWDTALQRAVPPDMLSRVSSYDTLGSLCLLPAGYALAGPMASWLGAEGALWVGAVYVLVSTMVVLVPRSIRQAGSAQAASPAR